MKIGFCYDTKSDYGLQEDNKEYTDFVSLNTVTEIKYALERCGHDVVYIGNAQKLRRRLENKDLKVEYSRRFWFTKPRSANSWSS